jgi:signal transduction histidine kinase
MQGGGAAPAFEKVYVRRDGTRLPILIGAAPLESTLGRAIAFVIDNTGRKRAERALAELNHELEERVRARTDSFQQSEARAEQTARALAESEKQLRALAAHLQTVREDERTQLAREIHDVLGQEITGLKMDVAWLARRLASLSPVVPEAVLQRLQSMQQLMDASIMTVRRMATDLRPAVLDDLGLTAALEWQARELERRSGLTVLFTGPGDEAPLDRPRATALFRIFQELLTNIARHAQARTVEATMRVEGQAVVLEVSDDGRGMSEKDQSSGGSLGLLGIRERALAVGGSFSIDAAPGEGTRARVAIPLAPGGEQ